MEQIKTEESNKNDQWNETNKNIGIKKIKNNGIKQIRTVEGRKKNGEMKQIRAVE